MNKVLSQNFSLEVYRRFQSLCDVSDIENSLDSTYDSLIVCTEEVAKEMLPLKKKSVKNKAENSTPVALAREKLKETSLQYHKNPSRTLKQKLKVAKKNLDDAYLKAEADFILGKISTLEHLHTSNKNHQTWKTVKELSGKSSNSSSRIQGGSNKARQES